jgi:NADP-dependent 3-hydroxy acid dehydrogenase YdfG
MSTRRVTLVTEATYGIGRGILDRLMQDEGVAFAVARQESHLTELVTVYPEVGTFAADLTEPDAAAAAIEACTPSWASRASRRRVCSSGPEPRVS